jgi:hypothetical protein
MTQYRILLLGDSHIPRRAKEVPDPLIAEIIQLSERKPFDYTLFTGDLVKFDKLIKFLSSHTKERLLQVMGNMDYYAGNRDSPVYQKVIIDIKRFSHESLIIGLTHGSEIKKRGDHSQLEALAKQKGYNILVSGHTHKEEVALRSSGILLLNPGSITGAWSFIASEIPSFIFFELNSNTGEIQVELNQLQKSPSEIKKRTFSFIFEKNQIKEK